jgi:hypothetical protein
LLQLRRIKELPNIEPGGELAVAGGIPLGFRRTPTALLADPYESLFVGVGRPRLPVCHYPPK